MTAQNSRRQSAARKSSERPASFGSRVSLPANGHERGESSPSGSGEVVFPLDSIIITGELARRPAPQPRYETENHVCFAIARSVAESPQRVFDQLTQAALELCNAHSAGISLLDEREQRFCWQSIAGQWSARVGGGTPTNFGPCAVVVERSSAQLLLRPQRCFKYLSRIQPPIEEVLLIPFHAHGKAAGVMWVMSHDKNKRFNSEDLRVMNDLVAFASAAYHIIRSTRSAELADAQRLQDISSELIPSGKAAALYDKILAAAIAIMRSDFGSMQMLDAQRGELQLLSFRGFSPESAKFWEWVRPASGSACGAALETGKRVIVPDVETCEFVAGAEDLRFYRHSKIRAVQSTPLVSRSGELLGMISTHWRQPHNPGERELGLLDILARQAADVIERRHSAEALQRANDLLEVRVQTRTRELEAQIRETKRAEEGLRAITERLFKLQDKERRHIARELHAGASQSLAALSMNLGRLAKFATRMEELEVIHACHAGIDHITREIRTISYLLHPPLLEEMGLGFALRVYVRGFSERSGIPVRVENEKLLENLPDDSEIAVFRVVQESLANIHRHSGATEAKIRVALRDGGLRLTISDNGKGLSAEKQRELAESVRAGVGILGMRERIRQLGGTLEIFCGVPSGAAAEFAEAFSLLGRGAPAGEARGNEKPAARPPNGAAPAKGAKRRVKRVTRPGTSVSLILPLTRMATA